MYLFVAVFNSRVFTFFIFFVLFQVSLFVSKPAFSQSFYKYSSDFLSIGLGARYQGMGGASVSFSDDVSAIIFNPVAIKDISCFEADISYASNLNGLLNHQSIGFAMPIDSNKSFAFSIFRNSVENIPDTRGYWDYENQVLRNLQDFTYTYFSATDYIFITTFSFSPLRNLALGVNFKFVYKFLGSIGFAWGVGLDAGAIYSTHFGLAFGITVQNISTTLISWSSGTRELVPPSLILGISYRLDNFLYGRLITAFEINTYFERRMYSAVTILNQVSINFAFGIEYEFLKTIAVRFGVQDFAFNSKVTGSWSLGAGVRVYFFALDYAIMQNIYTELGLSHRITLSVKINGFPESSKSRESVRGINFLEEVKKLIGKD